jgi:DNA replication protein
MGVKHIMTTYNGPSGFSGFPSGKNPFVPIPEVFFTHILPEIEDSAELKVTLHIFYLLAKQQGSLRCTSDRDLLNDQLLLRGLKRRGDLRPPQERVRLGLEQAVTRGTLLKIQLRLGGTVDEEYISWYFFNTTRSRRVVAELQGGEMMPVNMFNQNETIYQKNEQNQQVPQERNMLTVAAGMYAENTRSEVERGSQHVQVRVERPNIFTLYEQNIGLLSPIIADQLKDAADQYPPEWIEDAFRGAVEQNKRKWSYVRAILRNWEIEGR